MWFRNDLFTLRTQPDLLLCNVYLLYLLIYYENLDIFSESYSRSHNEQSRAVAWSKNPGGLVVV